MLKTRVLVVADEDLAANELADDLRKNGYDVAGITSSGLEALKIVTQALPDLVLMDIRLKGGMDGIATAERMHKDFDLPVIFLAANSDTKTFDRAKIAEPFGYLTKPFKMADLSGAIAIALQKHLLVQKLKERETWLTVTLGSAGDGVIVTDAAGRIRFLNQLSKEILGLPDVDVTGQPWPDVVQLQSKITGVPAGDLVQLAILQGATMNAGKDLKVTSPAGETREVEGEIALCRVDDAVIGTVFTFRDVTLRNRQEEQAQQELRNQAVGQLASAISKQVGTLLQTALDYSDEALREIEADHKVRGSLEVIKTRVEDMFRIASQLFTLKSNAASYPRVFDLNAVVSEVCFALRQDYPREIELVTDLSADLGEIRADAAQIRRAIVSLAGRARTGMPKGGEIRISTRNCALERRGRGGEIERYVSLTVGDTGPGLSQEEARRLFDPFSQSDELGGLDLSLFLVHRIVADARGSISATGNPGEGTTFEILLPQSVASGDTATPSESLQVQEGTILLVEADAGIRNFLGDGLQADGYEVLGACSFAEATGWMESYEGPIDMLITNLVMSEKSGPELAQQMLLRHPALKAVFISDQPVDSSLKETWLSQGATFLDKPFRQEELTGLVHQVLEEAAFGIPLGLGGSTIS